MAAEAESKWWSQDTVAVVTGGNKGIGLAIVKQLAEKGITVVLTARDVKRGEDATKQLVDQGLPVVFHQLDVRVAQSAQKLADWLKQEYGGVDILVNNAGVLDFDPNFFDGAETMVETNFYGSKHVTRAIFPLLRASAAGARILNVSSLGGKLQLLTNEPAKQILANVEELSEEAIDKLIDEFYADMREQKLSKWVAYPINPGYFVSKACLNAYTRLVAKQVAERPVGQKIYVNCFCPGYTSTDLGDASIHNWSALMPEVVFHSCDVAAANALWLILLPASESPTGVFSTQRVVIDY